MTLLAVWAASYAVGFLTSLYAAWVASYLWLWYITPIFNIAVPSIWLLIGLAIFARLFTYHIPPMQKDDDVKNTFQQAGYALSYTLLYTTSAFVGGWVFQHFA